MSTKTHTLLSELHRLLGTYTVDDFTKAARYPGLSKYLRSVFEALADEAGPDVGFDAPLRESAATVSAAAKRNRKVSSVLRVESSKTEILDVIRRSRHFEDNRSLIEFARESGIGVRVVPKESRERLARRLAGAISALPSGKRANVLVTLMADTKSQTQGWMDVIRGTKS